MSSGNAADARRSQYQGVSLGVRRAQRRAALLEVTIELIASEGLRAVTVRGVSTRARLNQRYFYESFANREELLVAAFAIVRDELMAVLDEAIERTRDATRAEAARVAAEAYISCLADPPHRGRVLLIDPEAEPALRAVREDLFLQWADHLTRDVRGMLGFDERHAARLRVRMIVLGAGINEVVHSYESGQLGLSRKDLGQYVAEAMVALTAVPADEGAPHD